MSATEEVGRVIGGKHTGSMAAARAGIRVDGSELKKISKEFDVVRTSVTALRKEMDALNASAGRAGASARGVAGGASPARAQNGMPMFQNSSLPVGGGGGGTGGGGGGGGAGGGSAPRSTFARMGSAGLAAVIGGQIAGQAVGAIDQRIDRGRSYASDLDRLNIILQQQTGRSQLGVMSTMRQPLTNYRLGDGGINAMLAYQAQYGGSNATPQIASSIAGIRALSGYTKTTADVLQDQQSLMSPQVANRMQNTLGVSAYSIGGGTTDPIKLRQQITQRLGLTNASVMKGARSQGSAVRAMMTDAGIPQEVQDEVLTYAQSNLTYREKGGKGMYNPANKSDRKRMGIEDNFATQQEETARIKATREEDFSRRQIDNMAALEKSNQSLIKALGSLEDKISGLVGARTSGRNFAKIGGRILQVAGAATMAAAGWTGAGAVVGGAMIVGGSTMSGDPEDPAGAVGGSGSSRSDSSNDASISIPVGDGSKRAPLNSVKQRADFRSLNPKMQDRLLSMFRENPNVGIGGGTRSSSDQRSMFLSRYRRTSNETKVFWDGSYWEHVSGAAASPPGRSMHEIGLAADLVGDLGWMNKNAARFGLKHFAGVNNEPWHVQPAELPSSRREYEKNGSPWGSDGSYSGEQETGTRVTTGAPEPSHPDESNIGSTTMRSFSGMSIAEIISSVQADAAGRLLGGGSGTARNLTPGYRKSKTVTGKPTATAGGGVLSGEDVARFAAGAGFRKQDLINMVAISKRESRWNPRAYNGNLKTGDKSYGLWQINTLNGKGGKMGDLVNDILGMPSTNTNFDALFDPATNARVAHEFYKRNGNTLRPWGGYKGQSNTHGADQYIGEAAQAVKNAGLGDPMPSTMPGPSRSSSVSVQHAPTYQITVAPNINFNGTPSTPDLRRIAQEVTAMMHEQVRTLEMRNA